MPIFKINWEASGTAEVEADDPQEATLIVEDNLRVLDSTLLESIDVDEVDATIDDGRDE